MLGRKFDWTEERSSQALRALGDAATVIDPQRLPEVIEGGHADYVVTGDRRHLLPLGEHQGARILNAPRFLSALAQVR